MVAKTLSNRNLSYPSRYHPAPNMKFSMGTLDLMPNIMHNFYEAYIFFYQQLHSKKFQIEFKLKAGDIFCFDNRRVLHGRREFNANSGNRHLQGYYIEREEIISKLNYLKRIKV